MAKKSTEIKLAKSVANKADGLVAQIVQAVKAATSLREACAKAYAELIKVLQGAGLDQAPAKSEANRRVIAAGKKAGLAENSMRSYCSTFAKAAGLTPQNAGGGRPKVKAKTAKPDEASETAGTAESGSSVEDNLPEHLASLMREYGYAKVLTAFVSAAAVVEKIKIKIVAA